MEPAARCWRSHASNASRVGAARWSVRRCAWHSFYGDIPDAWAVSWRRRTCPDVALVGERDRTLRALDAKATLMVLPLLQGRRATALTHPQLRLSVTHGVRLFQMLLGHREGHEASRSGLYTMPRDQHLAGHQGIRETDCARGPDAMPRRLQVPDERQHREHGSTSRRSGHAPR